MKQIQYILQISLFLLITTIAGAQKNPTATQSTHQGTPTGTSSNGSSGITILGYDKETNQMHHELQTSGVFENNTTAGSTTTNGTTNTGVSGGIATSSSCPLMYVDVDIPFLQSCLSSTARISYCNHGNSPATNSYIEVTLDSVLTLDSAAISYTALGGNRYRFDIGTVQDSACSGFDLQVSTLCDINLLNQSHCITAHIYPDTVCAGVWNNYILTSDGECYGDSVLFTLANQGTTVDVSHQIRFIIIDDHLLINGQGTIVKQGVVAINSGGTQTVSLATLNGTTANNYRLKILDANDQTVSSTVVGNCTVATLQQSTVRNHIATQLWNGSAVPWEATGCASNGVAAVISRGGNVDTEYETAATIDQSFDAAQVEVRTFPNPFDNYTTIRLEGEEVDVQNLEVFLYDITGRQVRWEQVQYQNYLELARQDLQAGVYFYRVEANKKLVGTGKLMVQ